MFDFYDATDQVWMHTYATVFIIIFSVVERIYSLFSLFRIAIAISNCYSDFVA